MKTRKSMIVGLWKSGKYWREIVAAAAGAIDVTLSDDDFSDGETATAEIPLKGDTPPTFFKATIE